MNLHFLSWEKEEVNRLNPKGLGTSQTQAFGLCISRTLPCGEARAACQADGPHVNKPNEPTPQKMTSCPCPHQPTTAIPLPAMVNCKRSVLWQTNEDTGEQKAVAAWTTTCRHQVSSCRPSVHPERG